VDDVSNIGGITNMRRIFLPLLISVVILSCDDSDSGVCNVADPVHDLEWLRSEIESIELDRGFDRFYHYRYFAQGVYNGETVFFQSTCCPPCSFIPTVILKNCEGEEVAEVIVQYGTPNGKIKFQKTIWHAEGFPCED
jgi:hypothetical protein